MILIIAPVNCAAACRKHLNIWSGSMHGPESSSGSDVLHLSDEESMNEYGIIGQDGMDTILISE